VQGAWFPPGRLWAGNPELKKFCGRSFIIYNSRWVRQGAFTSCEEKGKLNRWASKWYLMTIEMLDADSVLVTHPLRTIDQEKRNVHEDSLGIGYGGS
jgi:hypothetical protein